MKNQNNRAYTENSALSNRSTLNPVLDLFSKMGVARGTNIVDLFSDAFDSDPKMAVKALFYLRNPRGGLGERDTARSFLTYLFNYQRAMFHKVFTYVPLYGRWDDLIAYTSDGNVTEFIYNQLMTDYASSFTNAPITNLAKWMPSENAGKESTKEARRVVRDFNAHGYGMTMRNYRVTLSTIRRKLRIVESYMSANNWSGISYEHVPSRASLIYKDAFKNHDEDRYGKYIQSVLDGKSKINAKVLFPYEFARAIKQDKYSNTLDALWNNLPNYLRDGDRALFVSDASSSMYSEGAKFNSGIYAGELAASLALYFADKSTGFWKGHYIEFADQPKLYTVPKGNLKTRMEYCLHNGGWPGGSTNFQGVFDLILKTAKAHNLSQEDMPTVIFAVSDMQFNPTRNYTTNHEEIAHKYARAGYKMPFIVYWQVSKVIGDTPVTMFDKNTMIISGLNPSIFEAALKCEELDPYESMVKILSAYDHIFE